MSTLSEPANRDEHVMFNNMLATMLFILSNAFAVFFDEVAVAPNKRKKLDIGVNLTKRKTFVGDLTNIQQRLVFNWKSTRRIFCQLSHRQNSVIRRCDDVIVFTRTHGGDKSVNIRIVISELLQNESS